MLCTVKHYAYFGANPNMVGQSLLSTQSWDAIRVDDNDTPYSIPKDRSAWIRKCNESAEIVKRANIIVDFLKKRKVEKVVSVGVGCASLEYHIKSLYPLSNLVCTDYTSRSIDRLKSVFTECDLIQTFDMLNDEWNIYGDGLYLLNRVDTEFDNNQWKHIFLKMYQANIKDIMLIATGFLTLKTFLNEYGHFLINKIRGRKISFCGYIRTKDVFRNMWRDYYKETEFKLGNLTGFILERK